MTTNNAGLGGASLGLADNSQKLLGYNGKYTKLIEYTEPYPTRAINLETEGHMIERVKELRGKLTSKYKKSGNFAYAETEIEGLGKGEFYAQSSIDEFTGELTNRVPDISLKPKTPEFKSTPAANTDGEMYDRQEIQNLKY